MPGWRLGVPIDQLTYGLNTAPFVTPGLNWLVSTRSKHTVVSGFKFDMEPTQVQTKCRRRLTLRASDVDRAARRSPPSIFPGRFWPRVAVERLGEERRWIRSFPGIEDEEDLWIWMAGTILRNNP